MASNFHEQGPAVHYLRSIRQPGGVFAACSHIVMDGRYSTLWEYVTCGNCLRTKEAAEPKKKAAKSTDVVSP